MVKNPLSERDFLFKAFLDSGGESGIQPCVDGPQVRNRRTTKLPIGLGLNSQSARASADGKPQFRTREEHMARMLREHS